MAPARRPKKNARQQALAIARQAGVSIKELLANRDEKIERGKAGRCRRSVTIRRIRHRPGPAGDGNCGELRKASRAARS